MSFLELKNVSKGYGRNGGRVEVLRGVDLAVEEGEFVAILGFSGSGKTTLMSLMNGLQTPDEGQVLLKGKPVQGPGPDRGVVFQNYSLLPWLTVRGNVALAVDQVHRDLTQGQRDAHVEKYVRMVNLLPALNKRPYELSGGMRQRVSVARALAMEPEILLLDEPLSALDALTRATLQTELENIWEKDKKTVVMVTNDIDEAILLADRILPLTPAPRATLGPEFRVDLDRPRERKTFNTNESYRRLRNDITRYFLELRTKSRSLETVSR
jgi:nitrate/nitrite transport system ATP-binding protein